MEKQAQALEVIFNASMQAPLTKAAHYQVEQAYMFLKEYFSTNGKPAPITELKNVEIKKDKK